MGGMLDYGLKKIRFLPQLCRFCVVLKAPIHFSMKYIAKILLLASLISCRHESINCGLDCGPQTEELIFQTGFKQTTLTNGAYSNAIFAGTDPDFIEKSDWEGLTSHSNIGFVEIGYEDGEDAQRQASIVADPDDPQNEVLKYQIFEPHIKEGSKRKGRIQLAVHDNQCINEIYQTVKLKLHPDIAFFEDREDRLYWFTIAEFWNNGAWTKEKFTFRISINLFKEEGVGNPLHFRVKSDYQKCRTCQWKEVWGETATAFPVVYGKWMALELYLKEGDDQNGRFYLAVTPENGPKTVLFDIKNTTQHPKEKCPDGFTHFEAMKMYLGEEDIDYMKDAQKELVMYWDDWRLYKHKMP